MLIEFDEHFDLPVEDLYAYFRTPMDWPRLFRAFGEVVERADGCYVVPFRNFPFPLVAQPTAQEPNQRAAWAFQGFWRGQGEVRFVPTERGVAVQGFERISIRFLPLLSGLLERLFLERRFREVWESGWRRLRSGTDGPRTGRAAAVNETARG